MVGILKQGVENGFPTRDRVTIPPVQQKRDRQRRQAHQSLHGCVLDFFRLLGRKKVRQRLQRLLLGIKSQDPGCIYFQFRCCHSAESVDGSTQSSSESPSILKGDSRRNSQRRGVDRRSVVPDESQQYLLPWSGKTDSPFRPSLQALRQTLQNSGRNPILIRIESADGDFEGSPYFLFLLPRSNHSRNPLQELEQMIVRRFVL